MTDTNKPKTKKDRPAYSYRAHRRNTFKKTVVREALPGVDWNDFRRAFPHTFRGPTSS